MKKVISVLLLACMLLTLTACGSQPAAPATDPTAEATEAPAAETAEAEYKLGMGVSVSLDSSDTNKAQVDATVATSSPTAKVRSSSAASTARRTKWMSPAARSIPPRPTPPSAI